jgi:hypothetical protein
LPGTIAVGVVEAVIVVGFDLAGHSFLSFLAAIVVGPLVGGAFIRSLWWPVIAVLVAVIVGAGGETGPFVVSVPVMIFAWVGARSDLIDRFSRRFAESEDRSPRV